MRQAPAYVSGAKTQSGGAGRISVKKRMTLNSHWGDFCRPRQAIVHLPVVGPADRIQAGGLGGGGLQASGSARVLVDETAEPLPTHDLARLRDRLRIGGRSPKARCGRARL